MTMVEHVYRRTAMSEAIDETRVATPDEEIREEVESFGGDVIMTGEHTRATDRVAEAARETDAEVIVVMQGDEPLVYPEMLDAAIEPFEADPGVECVNLAGEIETEAAFRDPNNVKVVADEAGNALYFSREPVPNLHDAGFAEAEVYRQVCVIPFRRDALFEFAAMDETPLEKAESIDMLRLLERGRDVRLVETDHRIHAVDTPEDHERVNELMAEDPLFAEYGP
jgi:3-deoxy-manno-octulosonate cytidylyltransferase (CMP-KDO synthetase)